MLIWHFCHLSHDDAIAAKMAPVGAGRKKLRADNVNIKDLGSCSKLKGSWL